MRAFLSIFFLLTYAGCALAADSIPELKVRTADGGSAYRIGERIRLKLSFTSAEARRYEIDEASYDRSGRMGYESFQVSRQRVVRSTTGLLSKPGSLWWRAQRIQRLINHAIQAGD